MSTIAMRLSQTKRKRRPHPRQEQAVRSQRWAACSLALCAAAPRLLSHFFVPPSFAARAQGPNRISHASRGRAIRRGHRQRSRETVALLAEAVRVAGSEVRRIGTRFAQRVMPHLCTTPHCPPASQHKRHWRAAAAPAARPISNGGRCCKTRWQRGTGARGGTGRSMGWGRRWKGQVLAWCAPAPVCAPPSCANHLPRLPPLYQRSAPPCL